MTRRGVAAFPTIFRAKHSKSNSTRDRKLVPGEGTRVRRLESYLPTLTGLLDGRLGVRRWYLARLADSANTIHGFILNDGD
jgi:hypothetical protein